MSEYEHRVVWKRENWCSTQSRVFQRKEPALRLVSRLQGDDPRFAHLAPLEFIEVYRREVGEWEEG